MSDTAFTRPVSPLSPDLASAEELLHALLQVSLTATLILRPLYLQEELVDFDLAYLNPAGQRMLNLPERPAGSLKGMFPHTQLNGIFEFYRQVYDSGEAGRFDVNYQNDGLDNFFCLAAQRSGQALVVSFTDTSDQDRSVVEEALRSSQRREMAARAEADLQRQQLYNILMQAPALICIFDGPQHVFKLVNQPYQQLVGNRPIVGKTIAEAMPELSGQPIFELLDEVFKTGKSYYAHEMLVQLDHHNAGGELGENFYNFIYQPIHNLAGETEGIMVFAYEVTSQVKARRQVEHSHQEVQALYERLKQINTEIYSKNTELLLAQQALQQLNLELEGRVEHRTRALQLAQEETERQRQRLEHLFMQAPAAISILSGPDLVFELVNPGYQQLFPGRQLLGRPLLEALPEIARHKVYRTFRHVYQTGQTHEEKGLLIPIARVGDGVYEDRYFNFIQQARTNATGYIDGVLVFAFEVTDQVEARKTEEASARQMKLITDALPVLIGYLDHEEKYRFANKAYEAWFNMHPSLLLGRPVRDVIGEKAYAGVKKYIDRALAGEKLSFEASMPYREDFVKHIRTTYVPDLKKNKVAGFYTLVLDVTEQVEARKAVEKSEQQAKALASELAVANEGLRVANQQLMRTNVDLDNFIYTASHDLKAPILNIEGLVVALLEQLPEENLASPMLQRISLLITESVQRFKRTIDHLTDITKLQKENNTLPSPIDMEGLITDIRLDLAPEITKAQALVQVDVAACPTIQFSEKNLRSIIYNLLSNAIKYRSPERKLTVHITCYETDSYQVLCVKDNGLGIDMSQKDKLYAMFKRLHSHVEGSGIGLYMVKKIVENAGGSIEVTSRLDEGSSFEVYLPLPD